MSNHLQGSKVMRQGCVAPWLLKNRMTELVTYGSVGGMDE